MANEKKRSGPDPRFVRFEEEEEASGLGPDSAGQAGDTMGLSRSEVEGPQSVEELLEEGQSFEAGIISGVEDAPDADQGEVRIYGKRAMPRTAAPVGAEPDIGSSPFAASAPRWRLPSRPLRRTAAKQPKPRARCLRLGRSI